MAGDAPTIVVIADGQRVVAVWRLDAPAQPDLSVVETLATFQLAAQRHGWSLRLRSSCPRLGELLDLTGLAGVVGDAAGLGLEVGREPERGEALGVEEVVEPGDPPV